MSKNRAQSGPSIADMESRRQKPLRPLVPLSAGAVAGDAGAFPHTPAEAEKVPEKVPANVEVKTEH